MQIRRVGEQHRDLRLRARQRKNRLVRIDEPEQFFKLLPHRRRRGFVGVEAELRLFAVAEEENPAAAAEDLHEHLQRGASPAESPSVHAFRTK